MYAQLKDISESASGSDRTICSLPNGWKALGIYDFQATNAILNETVNGMITSDNNIVLKNVPSTWSQAYIGINFSYFCDN